MSQVETWSFAREGKVKHESEEAFSSESRENKRQQLKSRYSSYYCGSYISMRENTHSFNVLYCITL